MILSDSTKHISTSGYMKLIISLDLSITTSMTAVGIAHELYKKWVQSRIKQKDQIYISVLLLLGEVYINVQNYTVPTIDNSSL